MLEIRMATIKDFAKVKEFYIKIVEGMKDTKYDPKWIIDVYPNDTYLTQAIENNEMYIGYYEDEIISAMILNNRFHENYNKMNWQIDALPDEIMIIHTFGVLPKMHGKGAGREMMEKAMEIARSKNNKVIRLDVLGTNSASTPFYEKCGFKCIGTIPFYYEYIGTNDFILYEYVL